MPDERKLVTVLFADVTGSTSLGHDLDPEDVRALMAGYYGHARQVIADHGGTLEKFIGDAVMAVFGLPQAHGEDAERAVAAALALRQAVADDPVLAGMELRIGVNTGEVVTSGDLSGGDFLITGDAVNVAARLQQQAEPGEVLVSKRTHDAVRRAFRLGPPRAVRAKGKPEPLEVFPVEGVREVREIERPPLVGRKRELAQLELLRGWALDERRPQLISIVAPAGTGKTRLLEEFLAGLDPEEGWRVATGRCLPYGQSLTYWPLRGLLEDLAGAIEADRIAGAFLQGGLPPEDASRLADMVVGTLGVEGAGEETRDRESIFNAWRLLIETLAKEAPRVVVFEDLHWASDSLLDLVEHVMHPRTQAPLVLVAISRPELLDRRPAWGGAGKENMSSLVLKPLNEAQTEQLVEQMSASLPDVVRRQIVERSGGNPFFATELVRGMKERTGMDAPAADLVPDTVHAAVLARLDALSPTERTVVQAASVAGRSFRPATLAAVATDLEPEEVERAVDSLLARDLVVPAGSDSCTFRHVLIRDVAYGTLSRPERIRMHAAVAVWLEEFAGGRLDEFVELIAYHYGEAVRLSQRSAAPLPLPFDPARAVSLLERAGQVAARSGGLAEAQNHVQAAISIAPTGEQARLYECLGDMGLVGSNIVAYYQALQVWRQGGSADPSIGARLLRKLSICSHRWGQGRLLPIGDEEIEALLPEARKLAERAGDLDEQRRIRVAQGSAWWFRSQRSGSFGEEEADEVQQMALEAADYFEQRGDWEACSEALDVANGPAMLRGNWGMVIDLANRRLALPQLSPPELLDARYMVLWACVARGEYERCMRVARDWLVNRGVGEPLSHLVPALTWFGVSSALTGEWDAFDEITPLVSEALDVMGSSANVSTLGPLYLDLLIIALARDDRATVDAATAVLRRLLEGESYQPVLTFILPALVQDDPSLLDWAGLLDRSSEWATHVALLLGNEHGARVPDAFLDYLHRLRSIPGTADALPPTIAITEAVAAGDSVALGQAIEEAERHRLIPHAARMRIVLAEMTGDPAPLEQARPVLERLHDRQFLRRLDEVAAAIVASSADVR